MDYKTISKRLLMGVIVFSLGVFVGAELFSETNITEIEKEPVKGDIVSKAETELKYTPKEVVIIKYTDSASGETKTKTELEKTDLQADLGKTDFNVKINGKETTFEKATDEKFIFEKNKVVLSQENRVTFDVNVPTIDKTKRWGLGIGASKNGLAGTLDFPLSKSNSLGGWVSGDKETIMGGIKVKF